MNTGYEGAQEKPSPKAIDPEAIEIRFKVEKHNGMWQQGEQCTAQIFVFRDEHLDGSALPEPDFIPCGIITLNTNKEFQELKKRLES